MQSNKEFSEGFLNKLLDSAISYYNIEPKNEKLKIKNVNVEDVIKNFKNALKFEAHISMQNEVLNTEPILHAINLDSKTPGIISGKSNDKFKVHKKSKPKKEKNC